MEFSKLKARTLNPDGPYQEESVKLPLFILVIILVLIGAPLFWFISVINEEGAEIAKVEKYTMLVDAVNSNLKAVDETFSQNDSLDSISIARKGEVVTLVVPELVIIDESSLNPDADVPLDIDLEGIYWSPANPIAGINGETYHVGETIQNYEIIKIGKTDVHFKSRTGKIVIKDFYEGLLKTKK